MKFLMGLWLASCSYMTAFRKLNGDNLGGVWLWQLAILVSFTDYRLQSRGTFFMAQDHMNSYSRSLSSFSI